MKELIAKLKEAEKVKTSLKEELDKMSTELEKVKRSKEEAEVSDECFSTYDIMSTV